jgi:Ca2+/Na+ antiporter
LRSFAKERVSWRCTSSFILMKRTKLSNSLIITKICLLFVLVLLVRTAEYINKEVFIVLIIAYAFVLFKTFYLPDKIEFDDDYMFVKRNDEKREINLKDVVCIGRVRWSINNNLHKIKYYYKGVECTAKFYPRYFSNSLDKFKSVLLNKNRRAKVDAFWLF